MRRKARLSDEREAQLDSIGFGWSAKQGINYEKENSSPADLQEEEKKRNELSREATSVSTLK